MTALTLTNPEYAASPDLSESLRDRKKRRTHNRILAEAARLFGEQGYDATTMDAIADAADISRPTLFNYFEGKAGILAALVARMDQACVHYVEHALVAFAGTPARLVHFMTESARYLQTHRALTQLLLSAGMSSVIEAGLNNSRLTQLNLAVSGLVEQGRAEGDIDAALDPALQVQTIVGTYFYGLLQWLGAPDSDLVGRMEATANYLAESLLPRAGS